MKPDHNRTKLYKPMGLDKGVVGLSLALFIQAGAIVWHIAMMQGDIKRNSEEIAKINKRVYEVEKAVQAQAVYIARIDENISAIRTTTDAFFRAEVLGSLNKE